MADRAWLLLAYGDDRAYGGNRGYDDGLDHYSFDSKVPNWRRIAVGDLVVVAGRDGRRGPPVVAGIARVADIRSRPGTKEVRRCPVCRHPRFKERLTRKPRWRCDHGHEFDEPLTEPVPVTTLMVMFGDTYRSASDAMSTAELKAAQLHPHDGNAIRPLDPRVVARFLRWDSALEPVLSSGGYPDPGTAASVDAAAAPLALDLARRRYPSLTVVAMEHANPGYDLIVLDGARPVRYIEVKSTARADGRFFMSDYQRLFSELHADRFSLLLLRNLDLAAGTCDPLWVDGRVADAISLRPIQWQGIADSTP